ncbi:MAG TPA: lycopene cyclase domain-containing protein [Myxococcaceae bacterium]|nr:lycopene cyclase domain-containing protein [Myxococcaceae bacterium]
MRGHTFYLVHLLAWTLPVLAGQLVLLSLSYRGRFGWMLGRVLPPALAVTVYLVAADHLAIGAGVWHFAPDKTLGLSVGKVPLEEVLFFLITNLLVAFGLALFSEGLAARRRKRQA